MYSSSRGHPLGVLDVHPEGVTLACILLQEAPELLPDVDPLGLLGVVVRGDDAVLLLVGGIMDFLGLQVDLPDVLRFFGAGRGGQRPLVAVVTQVCRKEVGGVEGEARMGGLAGFGIRLQKCPHN